MIILKKYPNKNISELFSKESLSEQELAKICGGIRRKGKSRDKDAIDVDDI